MTNWLHVYEGDVGACGVMWVSADACTCRKLSQVGEASDSFSLSDAHSFPLSGSHSLCDYVFM